MNGAVVHRQRNHHRPAAVVGMSLLLMAAFLSGCVEDPARTRRLKDVAAAHISHIDDPDVQRRVTQREAMMFSDVQQLHRNAEHEGKPVTAPKLTTSVMPKYPFAQRRRDIQGFVWVGFVVDERGNTTRIAAIPDESGIAEPDFVAAATAAVEKWHFAPGTLDGRPAPFAMVVPVVFQLR